MKEEFVASIVPEEENGGGSRLEETHEILDSDLQMQVFPSLPIL